MKRGLGIFIFLLVIILGVFASADSSSCFDSNGQICFNCQNGVCMNTKEINPGAGTSPPSYSYGCSENNGWICPEGFECNHNNGTCVASNAVTNPQEEIGQRNVILNQFFINKSFGNWTYQPGVIYYNQSSPCLPEKFTQYDADYLKNPEGVHALVLIFPSKIENQALLENLVKCNAQRDIKFQSKTSHSNTYLFAKIPQTLMYSNGTQETLNTDNILWYNGTKIIYLMYYGNSFNSDTGNQLLNSYFDKYPSELVAPPGFFQKLVDFFRRLFGAS